MQEASTSFFNNLFGTIAGGTSLLRAPSNIDFIPAGSDGSVVEIKGNEPVWLGLRNREMQKYAYSFCSPLASIVDKLAEYDLNGVVEFLRATGKGKEDYSNTPYTQRLKKLFERPNPLQSWWQFRGQQVVYKKVFGFCPVLVLAPAGMDPSNATLMLNLPPWLFGFERARKGNLLMARTINDLVEYWTCSVDGSLMRFAPEQIFFLEDSFMQDEDHEMLLPQSRLVGLDMAVSNICRAMEANNVFLVKRGPLGMFAHDAAATKDNIAGYLPMSPDEKEELQGELLRYGLSLRQYQYIISRTAIKWVPTSFNVNELGIDESVKRGTQMICHRYGYSYVLMEHQDATYANAREAEKGVYQNNVIPNNSRDLAAYANYFKAAENNVNIVADFDDVPVLQEDAKLKAEAAEVLNRALLIEWENNVITKNQWLTARGYDTIPGGDVYKKDEVIVKEDKVNNNEEEDDTFNQEEDGTE